MKLNRFARWAGLLLGAATIALAAGAQSPQPKTPTPGTQPSTTNQQNAATPAQQTPGAQQQPEAEPPQATETLQLFSREVDLFFAVTDKRGNFVNGLQAAELWAAGCMDVRRSALFALYSRRTCHCVWVS